MTKIKERILGAISVMNDSDAEIVWGLIINNFPKRKWEDIEEVMPDDIDRKMLREIESDSECRDFISSEAAMKELGL